VGVNGGGKTTSIGKIASRFAETGKTVRRRRGWGCRGRGRG